MSMREFEYHICDVFTERPLQGNQLAVFLDAGSLTDDDLQAIARETNLSETTFIVRRDAATERDRGVRVRIFTTREELPFAGHPTLGTAATIRCAFAEYANAEKIVLDLNAGQVPVVFPPDQNASDSGEMTQPEPVFGRLHEIAAVAPLMGLREDDCTLHPQPQTVSTGLPFCIVLLKSIDAVSERTRVERIRFPAVETPAERETGAPAAVTSWSRKPDRSGG